MDNLITDELLQFYANEHASRVGTHKPYGKTGARNGGADVLRLLEGRENIKTVLDYGAGSRTLEAFLRASRPDLTITSYDPAIPEIAKKPVGQFDLVVSTDVLEHIEPSLIDNVLDDLIGFASKAVFLHIACSPCGLTLPDGRNAHLIVEEPRWWKDKLSARTDSVVVEYRAIEKLQRRLERVAVQLVLDKLP